jgi:hypothetical protein
MQLSSAASQKIVTEVSPRSGQKNVAQRALGNRLAPLTGLRNRRHSTRVIQRT